MRIFFLIIVLFFCDNIFSQTNRVAILDFENTSGKSEYDALGKSLSNMIITDLKNNIHPKKVEFYERAQLNKLLEEQKLQKSKNFDAKTAVDFGKLSGVNYVFVGAVFVLEGNCNITSKLVDVKTSKILITKEVNGKIESWLSLKSELAETIAKELNSPINLENEYKIVSTSLSTLNQYGKILSTMDTGDSEKAEGMRALFEETNPEFKYFKDIKDDIDKLKKKVAELENINSILTNDFKLGDKAYSKNDFKNSIKYFNNFIDNPEDDPYAENKKLYAYSKIATSQYKIGDYTNALNNSRKAQQIYKYHPVSNEIELISLLKLNLYDAAQTKYEFILDSLSFDNESNFRVNNTNSKLIWNIIDSFNYGLLTNKEVDSDSQNWSYEGIKKSGYGTSMINEISLNELLNNNKLKFKNTRKHQYEILEVKLLNLNDNLVFSNTYILDFYKLSLNYSDELFKNNDLIKYEVHLKKEIKRIENWGVPCESGCPTGMKIHSKKHDNLLYDLGLRHNEWYLRKELPIVYGKFLLNYFYYLLSINEINASKNIYNSFFSEHPNKNNNYPSFESYYVNNNTFLNGEEWDIILGIRIWDGEFHSNTSYPYNKEKFKIELDKKIIKDLKNLKIPIINFEYIK
jgi:TolB-like protein